MLRIDGKAFHSYTKKAKRPFDELLMELMNRTAVKLCESIQGAQFAYVQSDEISILLTDFETPTTEAWFDGNLQKVVSVSAAIATQAFNHAVVHYAWEEFPERRDDFKDTALFDSRVWTMADPIEVENALIWRMQDCEKNSLQMAARSFYSSKALHGKKGPQLHDLLKKKDVNWNNYPAGFKRGRFVTKDEENGWIVVEPPVFTRDRSFLRSRIPLMWAEKLEKP